MSRRLSEVSCPSTSPAPTRRPSPGLWALIIVILLPAVVIPLWVPLYDKTDPTLSASRSSSRFQFALILMSAVLAAVAYALSQARRPARERRP